MYAEQFYKSIWDCLSVQGKLVSDSVGQGVNVGETFTVRFTITNSARPTTPGVPLVVFRKLELLVKGTDYASTVKGDGWQSLPDELLGPTDSMSIDVEFKAIRAIEAFWAVWPYEEKCARALLRASLDFERFFRIECSATFRTDIKPEAK